MAEDADYLMSSQPDMMVFILDRTEWQKVKQEPGAALVALSAVKQSPLLVSQPHTPPSVSQRLIQHNTISKRTTTSGSGHGSCFYDTYIESPANLKSSECI
jgi:hypothetical protein